MALIGLPRRDEGVEPPSLVGEPGGQVLGDEAVGTPAAEQGGFI